MRLVVRLENRQATRIPLNHQEFLTGVMYRLLESSDADYSRFLHDDGYGAEGDRRRFKLFVFSGLRARRRRLVGDMLHLEPGLVEWLVASPVEEFLTHCATGLLGVGELRVGSALFPITGVETLASPDFSGGVLRGSCLTPIVAAVGLPRSEGGGTRFLRPADGLEFSEAVRRNLIRKRTVLGAEVAGEDVFRLEFDQDYLEKHRGGTKLITYKGIGIVGALAPFMATGSPSLLQVGYECGFGEKNAGGFGMVEARGG